MSLFSSLQKNAVNTGKMENTRIHIGNSRAINTWTQILSLILFKNYETVTFF